MSGFGIDSTIPRRAVVTGAARRIGRFIALALAEDGFDLALHVHKVDTDGRHLLDHVLALGRNAVLIETDLADPVACGRIVATAHDRLGPLGLLVNSAATFPDDRLMNFEEPVLQDVLRVDLVAPLLLSQVFARQLPQDARGVIVNLLDQRILKPTGRRFSYTLAKSALWTATRLMARELAPQIRVVAIGPGIAIPDPNMSQETLARLAAKTPLRSTGDASEVVAALRYLLAAGSVTGQMLTVDGGMHIA